MSVIVSPTQIGDALEHYIGILPQSATVSGTPINGTGIDRVSGDAGAPYESCDLVAELGTPGGTATSRSVVYNLQHSATQGSGYANYIDPFTGLNPTVTLTNVNSIGRVKVNLKGALQYIRVVCTPTFTTETSEQIAAVLVLGGSALSPTP